MSSGLGRYPNSRANVYYAPPPFGTAVLAPESPPLEPPPPLDPELDEPLE